MLTFQFTRFLRFRVLRPAGSLIPALGLWAGSAFFSLPQEAAAQTSYYRHIFFDNGPRANAYFYSSGKVVAPSTLELLDDRVPLDSATFFTPPNALRIAWQSNAGGSWAAVVRVPDFRNRDITFDGDTISFWLYSPEAIPAAALPELRLLDAGRNFSRPIALGDFSGDLPARKWTRVLVPFAGMGTESINPFDPRRLLSITFAQFSADAVPHTLFLDEIGISTSSVPPAQDNTALPAPANLKARAYERHIDLSWDYPEILSTATPARFVVYRSFDGREFQPIGIATPAIRRFTDFVGQINQTAYYKVVFSDSNYQASPPALSSATTRAMTDDELLTMLQEACFRYYWEAGAHPYSGLNRENIPGNDRIVATGAT